MAKSFHGHRVGFTQFRALQCIIFAFAIFHLSDLISPFIIQPRSMAFKNHVLSPLSPYIISYRPSGIQFSALKGVFFLNVFLSVGLFSSIVNPRSHQFEILCVVSREGSRSCPSSKPL